MIDLLSVVLTLRSRRTASLPANLGRASHALFLRLLDAADPGLATRLHDKEGPRPFTCSNLWGARPSRGQVTVSPEETCSLRYTALTGELSQFWLERMLPALPEEVELDRQPFRVVSATVDQDEHLWAGTDSYQDLSAPHLLAQAPILRQWTLRFASPTAFRSKGMTVPLPLPDLVFGSLVDRWNCWSPVALSSEVRRFASEQVAVGGYRLQTRALPFKEGGLQIGAVGYCRYVSLSGDRYWRAVLSVLADYAFFAGVGYQTTKGMGQARRLPGREHQVEQAVHCPVPDSTGLAR